METLKLWLINKGITASRFENMAETERVSLLVDYYQAGLNAAHNGDTTVVDDFNNSIKNMPK